jgi:hypothetical protein
MSTYLHMVQWNPEDAMGKLRWVKFKAGLWTRVDSVPQWVTEAYQEEATRHAKWGVDPVGKIFEFTGNSLKYRVKVGADEDASMYKAKIKQT